MMAHEKRDETHWKNIIYPDIWQRPVHDFWAPVGELEGVERLVGVGDVDVDAAQDQADAGASKHVAQE